MSNDNIFDKSIEDFLTALGLPSQHPYVEEDHETIIEEHFHEGRGHKEWSLTDYFTPHGHQPSKSIGTSFARHTTSECPEKMPAGLWSCQNTSGQWLKDARSMVSFMVETFHQVWPSLRGSFHLTLRLFAPLILIGAVFYLLAIQTMPLGQEAEDSTHLEIVSCIALGAMVLIMTDECYIQEYGRFNLVSVACGVLSFVIYTLQATQTPVIVLTTPFVVLALGMSTYCHIYVPSFEPGLYYNKDNAIMDKIVAQWPEEKRTYEGKGTPWLITGDSRTGIPFFLNYLPLQTFVRRWVPSNVPNEQEACILDLAFPPNGIHRVDKPMYLILHGLNGGSNEEYVRDFCMRATSNGSTVAILVTRGLMDSPVLGENLPHFARMSDIDAAAKALHKAVAPSQTLAGVGYSMGAIDLARYVASTGKNCPLDTAVAISGALDTRKQVDFHRSKRLWQPMLSKTLRDTFLEKFSDRLSKRLTSGQMNFLSKVDSLVTLDDALMVPYNGYKDLDAYYADMGAMGDFQSFQDNEKTGRISNVSIPLVVIGALDDPIGYIDTFIDPERVSLCGNGYTMLLLTRTGGHVGWPLGWNPTKDAWKWMSEVATSFVESADAVFQQERVRDRTPNTVAS